MSWIITPGGGGGSPTDHGALTGLSDDDHGIYMKLKTGSAPTLLGDAGDERQILAEGNYLHVYVDGVGWHRAPLSPLPAS